MNILITGCAGFIGYHLTKKLMSKNNFIYGLDNCNRFYNEGLKAARLRELKKYSKKNNLNFRFKKIDISNRKSIENFLKGKKINLIIHLAAQAGVRFSLEKPDVYIKSNIQGFLNIILYAKSHNIKKIIYASSSSVYGNISKKPFNENLNCNEPLQLYAVTKITNEYMAKVYSKLYDIKFIGLRFFTVYGPYGRPDMALFKFTKKIINNKIINYYSKGKIKRDFTYIDDIVESISRLVKNFNKIKTNNEVFNIGYGKPQKLSFFLEIIEKELGKKSILKKFAEKKEDAIITYADTRKIDKFIGKIKKTNIKIGVGKFISWYKKFYKIK